MTLTALPPIVELPTTHIAKPPVDHLSKLRREAYFYESAWADVAPFVQKLGDELVANWGFEVVVKSVSMSEFTPLLLHLQRPNLSDHSSTILLEIPTSIHSFLPRQMFPPGHNDTIIRPHQPIHIGLEALFVGPLMELVHLLQCFLPGVIPIPALTDVDEAECEARVAEGGGRCLPDVKWLLGQEALLREAFGCTYFRYLVDAAREQ